MKQPKEGTLGHLVKLMGGNKPKPNNKQLPKEYTVEEVLEMLQWSMEDHDVGWASVVQAPVLHHPNSLDPANKATIIFKPTGYNTTDKLFKITIEEL